MIFDPARMVAFDTETHLLQDGLIAPPLVCGSVAWWNGRACEGKLLDKNETLAFYRDAVESDRILVGANNAFDDLVCAAEWAKRGVDLMPAIFAKYERGEMFDVQISQALDAIARGRLGQYDDGSPMRDEEGKPVNRYSLYNCVKITLGRSNAKANDRFRKSYALLEHLPLAAWPFEARTYPVDDACNTLEVALAQVGAIPRPMPHVWTSNGQTTVCGICGARADAVPGPCMRCAPFQNLHDLPNQVAAHWAMHLGSAWGFHVDPAAVVALEQRVTTERAADLARFVELGFYKFKKDGALEISKETGKPVKDTAGLKRRVALAYGVDERATCPACAQFGGRGRVWETFSKKDPTKPVGTGKVCEKCNGTGLALDGVALPRTEANQIGTGRDALYESGDDLLMEFAEFAEDAKIESTYLPLLKRGIAEDGRSIPICPRPNVLVDSGRASYGDALDGLPRKGGVRECFTARPGRTMFSVDWGGIELVAHAQSCLWLPAVGFSRMAEAIRAGGASKVHADLAARMTGISPDEFKRRMKTEAALKDARTAAKWLNFGLPGGMGEAKLVLTCRKMGPDTECEGGPVDIGGGKRGYKGLRFCILINRATACGKRMLTRWGRGRGERDITPTCAECLELAQQLKGTWLEQWPENKAYFEYIGRAMQEFEARGELPTIVQHVSKRVRGGVEYCSMANGYFQALPADAMKRAIFRISREMYCARPGDALYGARLIKPAHDESIGDAPDATSHEAATRVSEIMVQSMNEICPDVPNEAPPALMKIWFKGAEPLYHSGRLVPWAPDHPKNCAECSA